jgi:hypothetical protein
MAAWTSQQSVSNRNADEKCAAASSLPAGGVSVTVEGLAGEFMGDGSICGLPIIYSPPAVS